MAVTNYSYLAVKGRDRTPTFLFHTRGHRESHILPHGHRGACVTFCSNFLSILKEALVNSSLFYYEKEESLSRLEPGTFGAKGQHLTSRPERHVVLLACEVVVDLPFVRVDPMRPSLWILPHTIFLTDVAPPIGVSRCFLDHLRFPP